MLLLEHMEFSSVSFQCVHRMNFVTEHFGGEVSGVKVKASSQRDFLGGKK